MEFFDTVIDFFNEILSFRYTGIYEFAKEIFAKFVIWYSIAAIKFKLFMMQFAFDVAQSIISQLNISQLLSNAWSALDSKLLNTLTFFRIPEALNIILSARVTRFVMQFMGI